MLPSAIDSPPAHWGRRSAACAPWRGDSPRVTTAGDRGGVWEQEAAGWRALPVGTVAMGLFWGLSVAVIASPLLIPRDASGASPDGHTPCGSSPREICAARSNVWAR